MTYPNLSKGPWSLPHPGRPGEGASRSIQYFFCKHTSHSSKGDQVISNILNVTDVRFTCPYLLFVSQELMGGPQVEMILKAEWLDVGRKRGDVAPSDCLWDSEHADESRKGLKLSPCVSWSCGSGTTISFWVGGPGLGYSPVSDVGLLSKMWGFIYLKTAFGPEFGKARGGILRKFTLLRETSTWWC